MSDQTPVPGLALHPHPHPHQPPIFRAQLPLLGLRSDQTPVPEPALHAHAHPHQPPTYHAVLRFEVCRLVKLQFGNCLYCFWSNQLLCIRLHR